MKRYGLIVPALVCGLGLLSSAEAATVYTRLIDTSFIMTQWYDYTGGTTGNLNFNDTAINGQKVLFTHNDVYTLDLAGTFTFDPILTRDFSSGGTARGYFDGGVTVTITGGLLLDGAYVYGGTGNDAKTILQATLTPLYEDTSNPDDLRWALVEQSGEVGRFNRTLFLDLVPGSEGLASGITIGTDTLLMIDPKMDLSLKDGMSANPANFYVDMGPSPLGSTVKITGSIPEPMTALLLGLGALCIRKRGR